MIKEPQKEKSSSPIEMKFIKTSSSEELLIDLEGIPLHPWEIVLEKELPLHAAGGAPAGTGSK